ncbi:MULTISPECIES: CarD family transcriptional regulator [Bacillaceae]|uniref:CarD family transcriptional regulator n=1 Tax=Bacillaceae TaxID=186817 RepID=UPI000BEB5F77|nr:MULTISPECIES: CarD family transcriptional regulator [unclassified Bacillus (in: firmicutes)]PEC48616.1 transcription factor YdeB [Bacillus sp. AFS096315]PFM82610.1 transcription factor YdeB [Bacillus sp. AFS077874]
MFEVGDSIFYPMQGAGVIESIQEKEVQGEIQQYFIIRLLIKKMEVMIPISKMSNSRIRMVVDSNTLDNILINFHNGESDRSLSYKQRFKLNTEKMKTGNIEEGAEVVRDLMRIDKEKSLNSSEKQMLGNASKIFISELELVKGISESQAKELLFG